MTPEQRFTTIGNLLQRWIDAQSKNGDGQQMA